jgi:hypothetical protein
MSNDKMLEMIKARSEQAAARGKSGGKGQFLKLEQEGEWEVRFLPAKKEGEVFIKEFGEHWIDGKQVYCPKLTANNKCPICEASAELKGSDDPDNQALSAEFRARKQHFANVIVRDKESEGPKIYKFGIKLATRIYDDCVDEEQDISDVENGYDYRIKKQKVDGFPNYDRSKPVKKSTPASDSDKDVSSWIEAMTDVHDFVDSQLKSYKEIKEFFTGTAGDVADVTEDVESEEFDANSFLKEVDNAVS